MSQNKDKRDFSKFTSLDQWLEEEGVLKEVNESVEQQQQNNDKNNNVTEPS